MSSSSSPPYTDEDILRTLYSSSSSSSTTSVSFAYKEVGQAKNVLYPSSRRGAKAGDAGNSAFRNRIGTLLRATDTAESNLDTQPRFKLRDFYQAAVQKMFEKVDCVVCPYCLWAINANELFEVSLDRIDNTQRMHPPDNVVFSCSRCNEARGSISMHDWLTQCQKTLKSERPDISIPLHFYQFDDKGKIVQPWNVSELLERLGIASQLPAVPVTSEDYKDKQYLIPESERQLILCLRDAKKCQKLLSAQIKILNSELAKTRKLKEQMRKSESKEDNDDDDDDDPMEEDNDDDDDDDVDEQDDDADT